MLCMSIFHTISWHGKTSQDVSNLHNGTLFVVKTRSFRNFSSLYQLYSKYKYVKFITTSPTKWSHIGSGKVNLLFQPYGTESSSLFMIFFLFLGCSGFMLLVFLISKIFLHCSDDNQVLVDDDDTSEDKIDDEESEICLQVVKQKQLKSNFLVSRVRQLRTTFSQLFYEVAKLPLSIYLLYTQCSVNVKNDFVTIP